MNSRRSASCLDVVKRLARLHLVLEAADASLAASPLSPGAVGLGAWHELQAWIQELSTEKLQKQFSRFEKSKLTLLMAAVYKLTNQSMQPAPPSSARSAANVQEAVKTASALDMQTAPVAQRAVRLKESLDTGLGDACDDAGARTRAACWARYTVIHGERATL